MIPALRLALALLLVLLCGGAAAFWLLPRRIGASARLGTALALGAPLGGAVLAILLLAGMAPRAATWLLAALAAALLVPALLRRGLEPAPPESRAPWWIAFALALGTALFPLLSPWWRIHSDNWTHAGIVRATLERVPPLDPGFAGVELQYPWIYHAFVAGAHAVTGADVYALMLLLAAVALVGVVLSTAAALGRERAGDAGWTLVLLVLGLNALFPLFAPLLAVRAFLGEVRGAAELARLFDVRPLQWETTNTLLHGLSGQSFFLDKFMVVTPFALSLAALTAWAASLRRWLAGGRRAELALAVLLTLAAGLMHPVTGVFLGASTGLAALLVLALARGETPLRMRMIGWTAFVMAGLVPVVLYTKTVIGGKGGAHAGLPFDLAPLKLLGYATCLALALLFAVRPALRDWRDRSPERGWVFWLLAGLLVALVSRLPGPSPFFTVDKLAYLVWIPLALTAGPSFASWMRGRPPAARLLLALALFLPVNGLALASRAFDPHNTATLPFDLPGFAWVRSETPKDAVLLVQPGDWESAGFGERDQYYSLGHPAIQLGYDQAEIAARDELTRRLFTTGRLTDEDRARLAALHRPVFAVWADFRDPMWRWTPGTIARGIAPPGPKPAFDPAFPVVFESRELEVRSIPLPASP